ncbi:hypothetical protein DFH27DRAFT_529116 [Peziza echinospora]|nr:hypothetical protein DFH27DRAFT_529116 [Peziza echinospora]
MPSFFDFQQGSESHTPPPPDSRYGRFRIIPDQLHGSGSGSRPAPRTYGSIRGSGSPNGGGGGSWGRASGARNGGSAQADDDGSGTAGGYDERDDWDEDAEGAIGEDGVAPVAEDGRWWLERWILSPKRPAVRIIVRSWWRRVGVLVVLPAAVTIVWCAIPFPTYPLDGENTLPPPPLPPGTNSTIADTTNPSAPQLLLHVLTQRISHALKGPGHGEALVRLNFWFFLLVYYGFYNLVGLMWITKLFNLYSLNWWPSRLGFPLSYTIFWSISLLLALPLYLNENLIKFTSYNMTWILLTFSTMTWPLLVAFLVLVSEFRHLSLPARYGTTSSSGLSETQALFHPSPRRHHQSKPSTNPPGRKPIANLNYTNTHLPAPSSSRPRSTSTTSSLNPLTWTAHLPSSYLRFLWFISLLLLSLLGYFLGESYAEVYLRTLPHTNIENIIYVYSWILTIHTLDFATSYILSTYILSYPLEWVFKLFFALTYQTFVRALYARLRSPQQFLVLQLASTVGVVGWYLLSMCEWFHRLLVTTQLSSQTFVIYQRSLGRSFFLRGLAENISMLAWLGWVLVLHYGGNKSVYPYFAFESGTGGWWPGGGGEGEDKKEYTFELTFFASLATWACEAAAGRVVKEALKRGWGFDVEREARRDLVRYPELVGAGVVVGVHVLQNMLVGIIRLPTYVYLIITYLISYIHNKSNKALPTYIMINQASAGHAYASSLSL